MAQVKIYLDKPLYGTGDVFDEYDSTGKLVRKWGKLVLDGTEGWSIYGDSGRYKPYFRIKRFTLAKPSKVVCTHYISPDENISINNEVIGIKIQSSTEFDIVFIVRPPEFAVWSVDDFKSFLAAQYAAGTPVTVIYQLAIPTEETITAPPLMLSKGVNVIDVDTEVKPTSMSITGQIK